MFVITTKITFFLSTFVKDSSRNTPGMSSVCVVSTFEPGCKNEPSSVVREHLILVWWFSGMKFL